MVVPASSDRDLYEEYDDEDDSSPRDDYSHEQGDGEPDEDDSYDDDSGEDSASGSFQREVENSSSLTKDQLQQEIERYKARLNGANRKITELSQGRTALETQWQQERAQYLEALMRERIQDLPPEEQNEKMQMFQHALQSEQQNAQHQKERHLYAEVARRASIMDIARKYEQYGITEEDLEEFDSAREMLVVAEREKNRYENEKQSKKRRKRRRQGSDNFEEPRTASSPRKEPQTIEEAAAEFKRQYRSAQRRR